MLCLYFTIPFTGNKMQKLFLGSSGTLLHQQYNAAHGLPYKTSCGPWSNLSLRPCPKHTTVHTFFQ